jgi:hypothetical protein
MGCGRVLTTAAEAAMFSGFETSIVDVGETAIFIRRSGSGRPLLLLHGFPQTHLMWHRVAPALVSEFTVVCVLIFGDMDRAASQLRSQITNRNQRQSWPSIWFA